MVDMIGCISKREKNTRDDNKSDSYLVGERLITLRMILVTSNSLNFSKKNTV